jgi:hypothetical protein
MSALKIAMTPEMATGFLAYLLAAFTNLVL